MADPIIITTPQLEDSTYTSGIQPALFKIQNTKFPINTEDAKITLIAGDITDNFGFAVLDLGSSIQGFEVNDYLELSNDPTINGVYRVQAKSGDLYTISVSYESAYATITPDVQKYYNNYFNEVIVYAIKDGDVTETQIGDSSLKAIPVNNVTSFNISGLLKSELNVNYNGARFYVEYRETFDEVVNGVINSTDNTYLIEEAENCVPDEEIHDNPNFSTNSTWTLEGLGSSYNGANQSFDIASSSLYNSIIVYQTGGVTLPLSGDYNITASINNPSGTTVALSIQKELRRVSNNIVVSTIVLDNITSTLLTINYDNDLSLAPFESVDFYQTIKISVADSGCNSGDLCLNLIQLESFSIKTISCQLKYFGIYGVNQFQNNNGFNFIGNVAGLPSTYYNAEFQSNIQCFRYFNGNDLKISYLLDPAINQTGDNCFEEVSYYDFGNNLIVSYNRLIPVSVNPNQIVDFNSLVDDFGLPANAYKAIVKIYNVPDNLMNTNEGGTFEDCSTFDFIDVDISSPTSCQTGSFANTSENGYGLISPNVSSYNNNVQLSSYSSVDITTQLGEVYELECKVSNGGGFTQNNASICLMPFKDIGGGVNLYSESDYNIEQSYEFISDNEVYVLRTTFTALDTDFNLGYGFFLPDGGIAPLSALFQIKNITVKGPRIDLTKQAKVLIDTKCLKNEIQLKWYNSVGGWEYFTFSAYKDYSYKVGQGKQIQKDVYLDFINGKAEFDYIQTEVRPRIKVRSQYLTEDEVNKISLIKESIEVLDITGGKPVVVQVDRDSVTFRKDNDKLYVIEFNILYPNRQTVSK